MTEPTHRSSSGSATETIEPPAADPGEVADEEAAAPDEPAAPDPAAPDLPAVVSRSRRATVLVAVLAVVTVALTAAAVVLGGELRAATAREQAGTTAVAVARQQAINLLTVDGDSVDAQLQSLLDGTTGDFRREFEGVRQAFADTVRQGQVVSTGDVVRAGLAELDGESARVLLALDSTVRNVQAPDGQPRRYRIAVDVELVDDRWLVSGMEFIP